MTTPDDIRSFLDRLNLPVDLVADNMWVAHPQDGAELVVHYAPPVLVLRVRVMQLPADAVQACELNRKLLEINARDLVHGSYGIEGDYIVLTDALELNDLDYSEFQASVDSLSLALASHLNAFAPSGGK